MKSGKRWITAPIDTGAAASTFTKAFKLEKDLVKATLSASAIGIYSLSLNGKKLGQGVLAPGFTSYKKRVLYQEYDITSLLGEENKLEIGLGQGWAVGYVGYNSENHVFYDKTALTASVELTYTDGSTELLVTDESWDVYTSHVLSSELYHGETVDLTAPITYLGKAVKTEIAAELVLHMGEEITEHERLAPVEVIRTPKGELVIDFGQNMTGYVEVTLQGKRGDRIVLHHAEVLDKDGNFYTGNFRTARNENIYVLSGGLDTFKPTYCFQGFRYVQLVEYPFEEVDKDAFRAIAVHSDIKRTGRFSCGNEKINQLYHNIIWGQKSNYLDIPTDCPQRDERLGWTGDAQIFCRTAAINFDIERFFKKWMGDVAAEQTADGAVYGIVPHAMIGRISRISAAWGDVACVVPWELYLAYGNRELLKEHFPMMKKWVDYLHSVGPAEFLWLTGYHYGDWLAMDDGQDSYVGATSNDLIASAYFAFSTSLLIKAGKLLGKDMTEYEELYCNVVKAFRNYFMENGMPKAELPYTEIIQDSKKGAIDTTRHGLTQTALVLILHFDLCTEEERPHLAAKLAEMIEQNGKRMTTGFVGTPYILHVLSAHGYTDLAYELLMQEENPSWLYSVCHGATTMWEHWNSLKEDGSFWDTHMNSFNHYAYGAVYDWIFGVALGIKPCAEAPAYERITVAPHPHKCLGRAEASIESRHGFIRSAWYYKGDTVYYEFEIPCGVRAKITLPSGYETEVGGGIYHFAE